MFELRKTKKEWQELKKRAKDGDAESEFDVALGYDDGVIHPENHSIIVERNPKKAIYWLQRSASHGSSGAMNTLGVYLSDGTIIKKDIKKALYWLKKAVRIGDISAATNIGIVYREIRKNRKAVYWFKRAIELGDEETYINLGQSYYFGNGIRKNYKKAVKCFKKAIKASCISESGIDDANFFLGIAYLEGNGVKKSLNKAIKLFKLANKDNDHTKAYEALKALKKSGKWSISY